MPEPTPKLYLRLGSHSEKQYVMKTAKLFDGVLVGANLLESTPGATVSFAIQILGRFGKGFAIDPMTYTFGMNLSYIQSETLDRTSKPYVKKTGLKKSFKTLAKQYGEPLTSIVLEKNRHLKPSDFTQSSAEDFSRHIFDYQVSRMRSHWDSDPQFKDVAEQLPPPSFVFAPYFYVEFHERKRIWKEWHELNLVLARSFSRINADVPKHSVLCIDNTVLSARNDLLQIAREYVETGCSACWMWISDFAEPGVSVEQLRNLVDVAHLFRDAGIELYNMHGGFLSALLSKHGMTGFSHGVGYGETKDVIPIVGVTVPTVNYHLPPLHIRVPMLELERALGELGVHDADDFHNRICDCTVCKGILKGNLKNIHEFGDMVLKVGNIRESQTPDSAKKCRFHFLLARRKEIEKVSSSSLPDIKAELRETYDEYKSLPSYLSLGNKADHLRVWATGI